LARFAYERRIERPEQENKELSRKLVDTSKTLQEVVHGPGVNKNIKDQDVNAVKLKEENTMLTKKNSELEVLISGLETNSQKISLQEMPSWRELKQRSQDWFAMQKSNC